MGGIIYGLCALTAFLCAWLLLRAYKRSKYRLLLWGGLCFVGLTLSNVLLVIDKMILPEIDLSVARSLLSLGSVLILLYGLIWDTE
jgi:hydrogenase/urease accessory protein HupE